MARRYQLPERAFIHLGMELPQDEDFSVTVTRRKFTDEPELMPTSPALRAARQRPLSMEETRGCQCKLEELRRLVTASRPDICARLAR